ncbi:MAG: squalene--hopene cyclase [Thermoguttaceae bacterium]|nr:squalene--hopene cyclase [Thermoguttaceae bacterium]MDW8038695.1 prenyltransferase/squalene oxidase repeat-containing protein [Thermoguttaceae bacterium]
MIVFEALRKTHQRLCMELLAERTSNGHWEGRLASSALSTATAIGALALVLHHRKASVLPTGLTGGLPASTQLAEESSTGLKDFSGGLAEPLDWEIVRLVGAGLEWLARTQNPDGGWGDTDRSPSNIATTMLVRAAVHLSDLLFLLSERSRHLAGEAVGLLGQRPTIRFAQLLERAARYIDQQGGLPGLRRRYGKDQTFAVPILTMYALAGLVGWEEVRPLPFEWAVLPHQLLGWVRLPVVSYAIPALVAMGQARFFHLPPKNPLLRWLRAALVEKTLQVLQAKQPASGGFLEAVPLTSFVLMALASTGRVHHPVVQRGIDFLIRTFRAEGAWPIDTNLATWVTTLSLNALLGPGRGQFWPPSEPKRSSSRGLRADSWFAQWEAIRHEVAQTCWPWLLECQHRKIHPFTHSAPGGWGWSDLSGAVPDADDTAGALLALAAIYQQLHSELSVPDRRRILEAVGLGLRWLVDLQNRDGGWPTFCRGWGALPFDRSAADLTAHALRALAAWNALIQQGVLSDAFPSSRCPVSYRQLQLPIQRGLLYLQRCQNPDGSWTPLWFGNAFWPGEENPIYGTARVLLAYRDLGQWSSRPAQRGLGWLLAHQNPDGGWGGHPSATTPQEQNLSEPVSRNRENESSFSDGINGLCERPLHNPKATDWQSSIEETALALEALLAEPQAHDALRELADSQSLHAFGRVAESNSLFDRPGSDRSLTAQADFPTADFPSQPAASPQQMIRSAIRRALTWLVHAVEQGRHYQPEPIGLYFARLWYYEKMYPTVFALSALGQAIVQLGSKVFGDR